MNKNWVIASGSIGAIAVGLIFWFALSETEPDWSLHIVVFNVGQADAIVMLDPNGQTCVIDAGRSSSSADQIADFLADEDENGVGEITTVKLGFVTHYDLDHMGLSSRSSIPV